MTNLIDETLARFGRKGIKWNVKTTPKKSEEDVSVSLLHASFDDVLSHFGRKGMRWGVRRSAKELQNESGSKGKSDDKPAKKPKAKAPEPHGKTTSTKQQNVKNLTDAELKAAVSRMQMEKQYSDLSSAGPQSRADAGRKFIAGVAANVMRTSMQNLGQSYANKAIGPYLATGSKALGTKKNRIPPPPPFVSPLPRPKVS